MYKKQEVKRQILRKRRKIKRKRPITKKQLKSRHKC